MDVITDNDWELKLSTRSLEVFKIHIWLMALRKGGITVSLESIFDCGKYSGKCVLNVFSKTSQFEGCPKFQIGSSTRRSTLTQIAEETDQNSTFITGNTCVKYEYFPNYAVMLI